MPGRIVEVAEDSRHLAVDRGFLTVSSEGQEIGRVPLDDIAGLIVNAHGCTYSNNLLVRLAERGAAVLVCGANHNPVAWVWPVVMHHEQRSRMEAQIESTRPLAKRLWQTVVQAKIRQQGAALAALGRDGADGFDLMARRVGSGDPDNMEAQAARRYWPLLFGNNLTSTGRLNIYLQRGALGGIRTARASTVHFRVYADTAMVDPDDISVSGENDAIQRAILKIAASGLI